MQSIYILLRQDYFCHTRVSISKGYVKKVILSNIPSFVATFDLCVLNISIFSPLIVSYVSMTLKIYILLFFVNFILKQTNRCDKKTSLIYMGVYRFTPTSTHS